MNKLIALSMVLLILLSGCIPPCLLGGEPSASPTGEPDREYIMINQDIAKGPDWLQIVQNSEFRLGDFFQTEDGKTRIPLGTYPRIDGSTVMRPLGAEFMWQHLDLPEEYLEWVFSYFSSTAQAYENLIYQYHRNDVIGDYEFNMGTVDLILVTEPSDEHLALAAEEGVELVIEPICWDAFVFITHRDNPVNSLTVEQIRRIYTGEITNWIEAGGTDTEIIAYQRNPNSGSQTTMENQVMNGLAMIPPPMAIEIMGMGIMIESVAEYQNDRYSIGYTFKYYIDRLYVNENIKVLEISGAAPTDENIRNQSYPFITNYYAVYRAEDRTGVAGQFVDWILSGEGQLSVAQAGYIPLR
jgi:phosphate transport system substrate-binding protein